MLGADLVPSLRIVDGAWLPAEHATLLLARDPTELAVRHRLASAYRLQRPPSSRSLTWTRSAAIAHASGQNSASSTCAIVHGQASGKVANGKPVSSAASSRAGRYAVARWWAG